jgi:hypothetical protein
MNIFPDDWLINQNSIIKSKNQIEFGKDNDK